TLSHLSGVACGLGPRLQESEYSRPVEESKATVQPTQIRRSDIQAFGKANLWNPWDVRLSHEDCARIEFELLVNVQLRCRQDSQHRSFEFHIRRLAVARFFDRAGLKPIEQLFHPLQPWPRLLREALPKHQHFSRARYGDIKQSLLFFVLLVVFILL